MLNGLMDFVSVILDTPKLDYNVFVMELKLEVYVIDVLKSQTLSGTNISVDVQLDSLKSMDTVSLMVVLLVLMIPQLVL